MVTVGCVSGKKKVPTLQLVPQVKLPSCRKHPSPVVAKRVDALAQEQDLAVAGQLLVLRVPRLRLGLHVLQNLLGCQAQQ